MHQHIPIRLYKLISSSIVILGCVTCVLTYVLLRSAEISPLSSVILTILFVASLAIGGRFALWLNLFLNRPIEDTHPKWSAASGVSSFVFFIVGVFSEDIIEIHVLAGIIAVLLVWTYALAKVRCWRLGCCGMSSPPARPVQIVEAFVNMVFGILLYWLFVSREYRLVVFSFLALYLLCRISFLILRGCNAKSAFIAELPVLVIWLATFLITSTT